jgi:hypothetical protein
MHAAQVIWGVVPDKFSTFLLHPTGASAAEKQSLLAARRADDVLRAAMDSWRRTGVITEESLPNAIWEELMTCLTSSFEAKVAFDQDRRRLVPWVLNPRAWQNRIRRERAAKKMRRLKHVALRGGLVPTT